MVKDSQIIGGGTMGWVIGFMIHDKIYVLPGKGLLVRVSVLKDPLGNCMQQKARVEKHLNSDFRTSSEKRKDARKKICIQLFPPI